MPRNPNSQAADTSSSQDDLPKVLTDGDVESVVGGGPKGLKDRTDDGRSSGDGVPQDSFSINFAKIEV